MWKYIVFGVVTLLVDNSDQNLKETDKLFVNTLYDNRTLEQTACNTIVGVTEGCAECYLCDHYTIQYHISKNHDIQHLTFYNDDCSSTKLCCVNQLDLNSYRTNEKCGVDNPEGKPRRVRPSVHSVLPGQYPWRAWVYFYSENIILCAATYVSESSRALVTLASCVSGYPVSELVVTFDKTADTPPNVQQVVIHPEYKELNPLNDIAILFLHSSDSLPRVAMEACLPQWPPKFSKSCISVSEDDLEVNSIIPLQSRCNSTLLHPSLMCTVSYKHAYTPELGGGLFCMEEEEQYFRFILYGILIEKIDNLHMYSNVTNHVDWLRNNIDCN
ncbi:salivary plasminogen activator beta-like [Zerene cesonia]|uniref:salivary plasminogen activator beta-like n=1 Tax=Zerene cesonia TaxID=33412 RepID=UPI0018E58AAA|nr:salivary plasminogen activator beta-like [Zerene cesonia]